MVGLERVFSNVINYLQQFSGYMRWPGFVTCKSPKTFSVALSFVSHIAQKARLRTVDRGGFSDGR